MRMARELRKQRFAESTVQTCAYLCVANCRVRCTRCAASTVQYGGGKEGGTIANGWYMPCLFFSGSRTKNHKIPAFIDTINNLHSTDLCYDIVSEELKAQSSHRHNSKDPDPLKSPAFVAEQFSILYVFLDVLIMFRINDWWYRVHNSYMLASGWTIVYESLKLLEREGLEDKSILNQLKIDNKMRTIYLLAYNLIKKLVTASQQRLRSIVQNTGETKMRPPRPYLYTDVRQNIIAGISSHHLTSQDSKFSIYMKCVNSTNPTWILRSLSFASPDPNSAPKLCIIS